MAHAVFTGVFPVFTASLLQDVHPGVLLFVSSLFCSIFFIAVVFATHKQKEILDRTAWKYIIGSSICNSFLFYGLILWGMQYTTANNAGVLLLFEIVFSFLWVHILARSFPKTHEIIGALLIVFGIIVFKNPSEFDWNIGDFLIILATMIAPFGNIFNKKANTLISAESIILGRNLIVVFILGLFFSIFSFPPSAFSFNMPTVLGIMLYGVVLLGIAKIFWIRSFQYLSIPTMVSINSIYPIFTLIFSFVFIGDIPSFPQILSLIPILLGVYILMKEYTDR